MHIGSYDDEPATVKLMHEYAYAQGYELDINDERFHHEIYISDPRKGDKSKLKRKGIYIIEENAETLSASDKKSCRREKSIRITLPVTSR